MDIQGLGMDFAEAKPAWAVMVSRTENSTGGTAGTGGNVLGHDNGCSNHDRIYCWFRLGTDMVVEARCRLADNVDFCGGATVSSAVVDVIQRSPWADGLARASDGGNIIQWDSEEYESIPNATDDYVACGGELGDGEQAYAYALYSLGCAVLTLMRERERNALIGCDILSDGCDDTPGCLLKMVRLLTEVQHVTPRVLYRKCVGVNDTREPSYGRRAKQIGSRWTFNLDTRLHEVPFHNRNSGNEVVNFTLVGAHGEFGASDYDYYEEDCSCDDCDAARTRAHLSRERPVEVDPGAERFYSNLFNALVLREYWYVG